MTIGLNVEQLATIFNEQYRSWSSSLDNDRVKLAMEYIEMGIPERDANIQSALQIRWEATGRAIIATFLANNIRIEADLNAQSKPQ
ncbi:MAG: hypothetical protein HY529_06475 [Chloroflexi bacterium]|nr:hypothetical protein [Chloroflexota bacterium]